MRSVHEDWYTTKEKLPKETDLCIGIRKNKYQFQISYKSGEWFDSNGKKIAEPDIWCRLQTPKEIFKVGLKPRYFNSEEEARELLNGKTYGEIREILTPCSLDERPIICGVPVSDNVVCHVDIIKHDLLHGTEDYAEITFNLNSKKWSQQLQVFMSPKNIKTFTISSVK